MTLWPLGLYRVQGISMVPTYADGDLLLGLRWFRPRPGQPVVAHQGGRPVIKRLATLDAKHAWLAGDNPEHSTDSRTLGPIPRARLEARIIAVLH